MTAKTVTSPPERAEAGTTPGKQPSRRRRRRFAQPIELTTLSIAALIVLMPFMWFVSVAFRPTEDLYELVPDRLTLANFPAVVDRVPNMVSYYMDSFVITGASVFAVAIVSSMAGFAFAQLSFPGRDVLFWVLVATIFVPHATAVASLYVELFEFGLLDTRLGLIFVYTSWQLSVGILIMRSMFRQVPKELEHAARIDGASMWQILWRIYIPLSMGGVIIISLISFVHIWGEYLFAFTFAGDTVVPMSLGIKFFQPTVSDPTYTFNVAAAAALLMFIPSIVIYIVFQKWFSKGVMEGALKG